MKHQWVWVTTNSAWFNTPTSWYNGLFIIDILFSFNNDNHLNGIGFHYSDGSSIYSGGTDTSNAEKVYFPTKDPPTNIKVVWLKAAPRYDNNVTISSSFLIVVLEPESPPSLLQLHQERCLDHMGMKPGVIIQKKRN